MISAIFEHLIQKSAVINSLAADYINACKIF